MDAIGGYARVHGLVVVEDAAQAHGAEVAGAGQARSPTSRPSASIRRRTSARPATGAKSSTEARPSRRRQCVSSRSFGERRRWYGGTAGTEQPRARRRSRPRSYAVKLPARLRELEEPRRRRELAELYLREPRGKRACSFPRRLKRAGTTSSTSSSCDRRAQDGCERPRSRTAGSRLSFTILAPCTSNAASRTLTRPGRLGRSERASRAEVLEPAALTRLRRRGGIRRVVTAILDWAGDG